jgi:hypothetical protein
VRRAARAIQATLAAWHALAATQNAFEILASAGIAPGLRPLASKNLELIERYADRVRLPKRVSATLLACASVLEVAAAAGFCRGAVRGRRSEFGFTAALALFGAFFLIDDAFDDYDEGARHRSVFAMLIVCYMATAPRKA